MIRLHLALIAVLALVAITNIAQGASVAVWHGPGPRACNGVCGQDWALQEAARAMPADVYAALVAQVEASPPERTAVYPGQMLAMNTFADANGQPVAEVGPIVAELEYPEPASGWYVTAADGTRWGFVQVDGCANWPVTVGVPPAPPVVLTERPVTYWPPVGYIGPYAIAGAGYGWGGYYGGGYDGGGTYNTVVTTQTIFQTLFQTVEGCDCVPGDVPHVPPHVPTIPAIPLPPALWFLAGAIGALALMKRNT